jgi:hypothetical protein
LQAGSAAILLDKQLAGKPNRCVERAVSRAANARVTREEIEARLARLRRQGR